MTSNDAAVWHRRLASENYRENSRPRAQVASSRLGWRRALGLLLISVCVLGCGDGGPRLVKAGGSVKYQGQPLAGADVVFISEDGSLPSIGRTDEQGRFELKTNGRPGAPIDEYKVAITAVRQKRQVTAAEAVSMTSEQIAANHESLIPAKYNNKISSELTATVGKDASANDFAFDLK